MAPLSVARCRAATLSLGLAFMLFLLVRATQAADDDLGGIGLDDDLNKAAAGAYKIEVVDPAGKPVGDQLFVRRLPAYLSVHDLPHVFSIAGAPLFMAGGDGQVAAGSDSASGVKVRTAADPNNGEAITWRSESTVDLKPGSYRIAPFGLDFRVGATVEARSPGLAVAGKTIRILTVPVTFQAVARGTQKVVPLSDFKLSCGDADLLDKLGGTEADWPHVYLPLTLYLPRGTKYTTSFGGFSIDEQGKVQSDSRVATLQDGVFSLPVTPAAAKAPAAVGKGYWVFSQSLRRVFKRGESAPFEVVVAGEPAATLPLVARAGERRVTLGTCAFPAVTTGSDARLVLVDMGALPPGKYELSVDHVDAHPYACEVVDSLTVTPISLHATAACNNADYTTDEAGLTALATAHVQWVASMGHWGLLAPQNTATAKSPYSAPAADAPAELQRRLDGPRVTLDNMLRHQVMALDYQVRRDGFYNEGLAFHHSYQPSVDRMVRRTQIFGQEYEDFPAFWGLTYTWFPCLPGYVEGGVPTDPYFGVRMEALHGRMQKELGLKPLSPEEFRQYQDPKAPPALQRQLADRQRAWFRAEQHLGWYDSFTRYNAKLREVRPDFVATMHENAGHDGGKSLRDMGGAHDAMSFESYTDYGDWPMSSGFVTAWSHGVLPGKPVWITVEGLQTEAAQLGDMMHAFACGAEGVGAALRAPSHTRTNRLLGRGMAFLERYGGLVTDFHADPSVAIMTNELDGRGEYDNHALWSHLTRLGYAPVVLSEVTVEEKGVPAGTKVVLLPNVHQPFSDRCEQGLQAFIKQGGKVLQVGKSTVTVAGVPQVEMPLQQIWEMGGFTAHLELWKAFKILRPELEKMMAGCGVTPRYGADPEKALIVPMSAGGQAYVMVISSPLTEKDTIFTPVTGVVVQVPADAKVINLVTGETLANAGGKVTLDLVHEPAALLALLPALPAAVALHAPKALGAGTMEWFAEAQVGGQPMAARLPMQYVLTDAQGTVRGTFYRLSGTAGAVRYRVGELDVAGEWKVTATELISGRSASASITVRGLPTAVAATVAEPVYVPHPARLDSFMTRKQPLRVIVEDTQAELLPLAEKVVAAAKAAGREVALQRVEQGSYDLVKLRWFPTPHEEAQMAAIDQGQMVGYRGNMVAVIDKIKRASVVERGGWTDVDPKFIIRSDVILFSGGQLAQSLEAVTTWTASANLPSKGSAWLEVTLSPFWADRNVLCITANDAAGREAAVQRLVARFGGKAVPAAAAFAPLLVAPDTVVTGTAADKLEYPLKEFVPPARALALLSAPDGHAAAVFDDRVVVLSPAGQPLRTLAAPGSTWNAVGLGMSVTNGGGWANGRVQEAGVDAAWHYMNAWTNEITWVAPDGSAARLALPEVFHRSMGVMPNYTYAFTALPDGKRYFAPTSGGGYLLYDLAAKTVRTGRGELEFQPFYESLREPVFGSGVAVTPDSQLLAYTTTCAPPFYGGMGSFPPVQPYGTSVRLVELATGKVRYIRHGTQLNDTSMAAVHGALAISPDGARVAWINANGEGMLLDAAGQIVWRGSVGDAGFGPKSAAAPVRCAISADGQTVLFACVRTVLLTDAQGKALSHAEVDGLVDARLAADGSAVYVSDIEGQVQALGRDGQPRWQLATPGERPRLALAPDGTLLVASGTGEFLRVDAAKGSIIARQPLLATPPPATAPPAGPMVCTGAAYYHESPTLALLQQQGAKQIAAWSAPAGQGTAAYGKTFVPISAPVTVSFSAKDFVVAHLVYRFTTGPAKVTLKSGDTTYAFVLDLPTPEYRLVDLPIRASGAGSVTLAPCAGLEVAELSVYAGGLTGPNMAFIKPADTAIAAPTGMKGDEGLGGDMEVLDPNDPVAVAKAISGKFKKMAIYSNNTDPDQIAGHFLKEGGDPIATFDGQWFTTGNPPPWTRAAGHYAALCGSRLMMDLGAIVAPRLCAVYARSLKQSEVMAAIGVLRGKPEDLLPANGDDIAAEPRVLAGVWDNDQFFRLFALPPTKLRAFGMYTHSGSKDDHGLSEVELY